MSKTPANDHNLKLKVVVSGVPIEISTSANASLQSVAEKALVDTGNRGQDLSRWELTTATGTQLSFAVSVSDAGLQNGDTIFLNLRAGVAG